MASVSYETNELFTKADMLNVGQYVVLQLDAPASLVRLHDPVIDRTAQEIRPGKYVGLVSELWRWPDPDMPIVKAKVHLLGQGLPSPRLPNPSRASQSHQPPAPGPSQTPAETTYTSLSLPLSPTPSSAHPLSRPPLTPSSPLPWSNLYHHTTLSLNVRIASLSTHRASPVSIASDDLARLESVVRADRVTLLEMVGVGKTRWERLAGTGETVIPVTPVSVVSSRRTSMELPPFETNGPGIASGSGTAIARKLSKRMSRMSRMSMASDMRPISIASTSLEPEDALMQLAQLAAEIPRSPLPLPIAVQVESESEPEPESESDLDSELDSDEGDSDHGGAVPDSVLDHSNSHGHSNIDGMEDPDATIVVAAKPKKAELDIAALIQQRGTISPSLMDSVPADWPAHAHVHPHGPGRPKLNLSTGAAIAVGAGGAGGGGGAGAGGIGPNGFVLGRGEGRGAGAGGATGGVGGTGPTYGNAEVTVRVFLDLESVGASLADPIGMFEELALLSRLQKEALRRRRAAEKGERRASRVRSWVWRSDLLPANFASLPARSLHGSPTSDVLPGLGTDAGVPAVPPISQSMFASSEKPPKPPVWEGGPFTASHVGMVSRPPDPVIMDARHLDPATHDSLASSVRSPGSSSSTTSHSTSMFTMSVGTIESQTTADGETSEGEYTAWSKPHNSVILEEDPDEASEFQRAGGMANDALAGLLMALAQPYQGGMGLGFETGAGGGVGYTGIPVWDDELDELVVATEEVEEMEELPWSCAAGQTDDDMVEVERVAKPIEDNQKVTATAQNTPSVDLRKAPATVSTAIMVEKRKEDLPSAPPTPPPHNDPPAPPPKPSRNPLARLFRSSSIGRRASLRFSMIPTPEPAPRPGHGPAASTSSLSRSTTPQVALAPTTTTVPSQALASAPVAPALQPVARSITPQPQPPRVATSTPRSETPKPVPVFTLSTSRSATPEIQAAPRASTSRAGTPKLGLHQRDPSDVVTEPQHDLPLPPPPVLEKDTLKLTKREGLEMDTESILLPPRRPFDDDSVYTSSRSSSPGDGPPTPKGLALRHISPAPWLEDEEEELPPVRVAPRPSTSSRPVTPQRDPPSHKEMGPPVEDAHQLPLPPPPALEKDIEGSSTRDSESDSVLLPPRRPFDTDSTLSSMRSASPVSIDTMTTQRGSAALRHISPAPWLAEGEPLAPINRVRSPSPPPIPPPKPRNPLARLFRSPSTSRLRSSSVSASLASSTATPPTTRLRTSSNPAPVPSSLRATAPRPPTATVLADHLPVLGTSRPSTPQPDTAPVDPIHPPSTSRSGTPQPEPAPSISRSITPLPAATARAPAPQFTAPPPPPSSPPPPHESQSEPDPSPVSVAPLQEMHSDGYALIEAPHVSHSREAEDAAFLLDHQSHHHQIARVDDLVKPKPRPLPAPPAPAKAPSTSPSTSHVFADSDAQFRASLESISQSRSRFPSQSSTQSHSDSSAELVEVLVEESTPINKSFVGEISMIPARVSPPLQEATFHGLRLEPNRGPRVPPATSPYRSTSAFAVQSAMDVSTPHRPSASIQTHSALDLTTSIPIAESTAFYPRHAKNESTEVLAGGSVGILPGALSSTEALIGGGIGSPPGMDDEATDSVGVLVPPPNIFGTVTGSGSLPSSRMSSIGHGYAMGVFPNASVDVLPPAHSYTFMSEHGTGSSRTYGTAAARPRPQKSVLDRMRNGVRRLSGRPDSGLFGFGRRKGHDKGHDRPLEITMQT